MRELHKGYKISILTLFFTFSLVLLLPFSEINAGDIGVDQNPVLGVIEKKEIRLSDVEDGNINKMRKELFKQLEIRFQALAVERLVAKHKEFQKIPKASVSNEEIIKFYEQNRLRGRGSLEEMKPQIKQYLKAQSDLIYYETIYNKALKKGLISFKLPEPGDFQMAVSVDSAFLWGNKSESVMFLEFSDYQCPFCQRVQPTLTKLREKFKNKVLFGYRHMPLAFHTEADEAAVAAECARDQGKFKPYHQLMFKKQKNQSIKELKQYAKDLKVPDLKKFNSCLDKDTYRSRVTKDQSAAASIGIRGTPSFIIGHYDKKTHSVKGEVMSGALPEAKFLASINKYLKTKDK